ncbi:hypothetical protein [Pseudorhodoferax sp.]|uniref:hypothetical protein n=1 Tax=Pseudorhodoferax sp. TaxID=1993553 RepID=UPI0039E3D63C
MHPSTEDRLSRDAEQLGRHVTDRVMHTAQEAVSSTRDFANQALDGADRTVRRLRDRLDPTVEQLAASAQRLAHRSLDLANETGARAQRSLRQYADATERYVSDQPVRAILIAAAAGAVIAALALASARRRRDPRDTR